MGKSDSECRRNDRIKELSRLGKLKYAGHLNGREYGLRTFRWEGVRDESYGCGSGLPNQESDKNPPH